MKKIPPKLFNSFFLLLFLFAGNYLVSAQTAKPSMIKNTAEVLSSGGGIAKFKSIQLEWTLGESFSGEATDPSHLYTIGFHQPHILVKPEFQLDEVSQNEIGLFPNPVTNSLNVKFNLKDSEQAGKFKFVLTDIRGKLIFEKEIESASEPSLIDIPNLPNAVYQVNITANKGKLSRSFKIVKTN